MTVTKYILVELDHSKEIDQIMKFLEDSFKTDKETRFRRLKGTGPYTVFVKAEAIDASVEDLIGKEVEYEPLVRCPGAEGEELPAPAED